MRVRRLLATTALGLATTAAVTTAMVAPSAHAQVVGGRSFQTTVNCGGSFMDITSHTATDNGAYVMVYVRAYANGQWGGWTTDSAWQRADAWASFFTPNVRTSYGYYQVYAYYASYTTAGWQYNGELVSSYRQKSGYSAAGSSFCLMGV
jgi:predicted small secreted protein